MKTKKYALIVLSILMILLVFASSASAADANATDVLSVDESTSINNEKLALDYSLDNAVANDTNVLENNGNNLLSADNNDENVLKEDYVAGFDEFKSEIDAGISSGSVILSHKNYKFTVGSSIDINDVDLCTIDGNGSTIDMNGMEFTLFNIMMSKVNIKNLIIKNMNSNYMGYGVIQFMGSVGSVENCTFMNNNGGYEAGAIRVDGTCNITNCTFVNNTAEYSGAINIQGSDSIVENCVFVNNSVYPGGWSAIGGSDFSSVDDNWWGLNNPTWNGLTVMEPDNYAVLNGSADTTTIDPGSKAKLTYAFYRNNTDDVLSIPARPITLSATGGKLDNTSGYLVNGEFSTEFSANTPGTYEITATVDNEQINLTVTVSGPKTLYVNGSVASSGNGSEESPFKTLKEALNVAGDGDTIKIASGTYTGENNTGLEITKNLNFVKYGDSEAIFDAEKKRQIWKFAEKPANITGLTFKNGKYDGSWRRTGGAIYFESGGNVINCNFTDNTANSGGAIYFKAEGNVINCTFTGNSATSGSGGAILYRGGSVINCTFTDNTAYSGGAIYNAENLASVNNCIFINNTADTGGAICFYSDGNVTNCAFVNNSASEGNAVYSNNKMNSIEKNWWGSNNPTWAELINTGQSPSVYAVLNITANPSEISNDKTSEIATKFVWNGTNENATSLLPKRNIKLSSNGNLTETEGYAGLTSQFSAADGGIYYVNATVDNEMLGVNIVKIPIPTNINVTITSLNLTVEETSPINATLNPSEAGSLEFNSSDDTVAVVEQDSDGNWIVRGVAKGNANITVSFPGSERYAPANKTIEVTVNLKDAKWTYIDIIWGEEKKLDGATLTLPLNYSPTCFVKDANGTGLPAGTNITISCKGNENYTINSVVQDDGNFSVDVSDIALGKYKVTFSAGKDYTTATATVTIIKGITEITVENETVSLKAGEEVGSGANLTPADAGNLTYTSSNESVAVVVDGKIKALAAGTANITVNFAGNDRYFAAANETIEVTVTLNDASVTVNNETLNLEEGDNFTIVATTKPKDLNVEYIQDDSGVYTVDDKGVVTAVKEGTGSITVSVGDNKVYAKNSTVITVIVSAKPAPSKENLTISAAADPITAGDNATVIVTGLKNATGEVYVIIKVDEMYSAPINDGKATITIPGLTESVTANVTYPGDNNYNNASTTVDITVNPAPDPSKKNLTIKASAEPIKAGENATVKVTGLENATGEVSVIANGKTYTAPIKNGEASITVPDLTENTTANVNYKGDGTYNAATTTVNITVNPAPVPEKKNLTIKANAEPITAGENATVKVTGLENATGNVSVRAGNGIYFAPIENGEATVIIPGLKENTVGQVSYPGDDNYNNASTTVDITVNPAPDPTKKNLTIKANAEPIKAGENATVKVTGLENATGEVSVIANGKTYTAPIKNGEASITVPDLTENTTANVNYKGDGTYNSATTTVNITVNPKGKENATISIDAPTEAPEGDNVTVTVTLPEDATGTVTIGNEAVPLVNGTASAVLTNLPAGNTTVPITYSGDEKYNAIETEINITVIEDKTINVKAPDVTKYYHGPERFVVNVTDSQGKALANKSVTININGVTYNRTTNGNGTCSLALNLPVGVYNVTTTVENNTVNSVVTIFTTVNGTDVVKVFRNGTQYYATFLDGNGKYLADGSAVRFNINGVMYDRKVTGDKGLAKLNINLEQGEYIITAINLNTTEMSSNNITVLSRIIENNDLTKFYRNASQYTVKIIGDDGKVVGAGVEVTFNVNGVLYTRQTNASGIAKLNINLPAGDYIITAECKGCKVSNNIKVLPVLTAQDMVKKYGAPDQFVATLVDGQGNPYARQTVQFNINGVLYNRVTDSAGQAKLNIRLMPGQYIITSSYNGCNIANKITVQG